MAPPVLMAISGDGDLLARLETELRKRYGADYEVVCAGSADAADAAVTRLRDEGREVAVVLADQWVSGVSAPELLSRVGELHPQAQRGLLIPWGEWSAAEAVRRAATLGQVEFWTLKPWRSADEEFHGVIGEALRAWARSTQPRFEVVRVVGERWAVRSHEIRDLLSRNNVPHGFYPAASEQGQGLLQEVGVSAERLPVLALFDDRTLVDPTNAQLAEALGVRTAPERAGYDVVVVGAGPSGLASCVYATSEGLRTALLEREAIGGQAGTTSLIRNYLGFPRGVSGGELAQRAYEQAWLFGTEFIYGNEATGLRVDGRGRTIRLADGNELTARAVVLASGVAYRRLGVPALEALTGAGVFYGAAVTEAEAMTDERVFVVGGGNSAGQAAVHLARFTERVTLLVRGASLADSMSEYLIRELESEPNIDIRYEVEVVDGHGETRLERLTLRDRESAATQTVPAAALFVLIGAAPRTDWLPSDIRRDRWGYLLTGSDLRSDQEPSGGWALARSPLPLETSLPGVFAVGDVRHGSVKRVASAVGEGSVSVRMIHDYLAEQ